MTVRRFRSYVPTRPSFAKRAAYEVLHGVRFASRLDRHADAILLVAPAMFTAAVARLRMALWRSRPPTVLWIQDLYSAGVAETPGLKGRVAGSLVGWVESWLMRSVDQVIVIHERFAGYIDRHMDVSPANVRVIRNWTHVEAATQAEVEAMRETLGW